MKILYLGTKTASHFNENRIILRFFFPKQPKNVTYVLAVLKEDDFKLTIHIINLKINDKNKFIFDEDVSGTYFVRPNITIFCKTLPKIVNLY